MARGLILNNLEEHWCVGSLVDLVCANKSRSVRPLLIRTRGKGTKMSSCEFWSEFRIVPVMIFGSWIQTKFNHRFFLIIRRYVNEFIHNIYFFERSWFRLRCETACVIIIKHVAFFSICAKWTMAFILTSSTLTFHTSVLGCGCDFGFEQK